MTNDFHEPREQQRRRVSTEHTIIICRHQTWMIECKKRLPGSPNIIFGQSDRRNIPDYNRIGQKAPRAMPTLWKSHRDNYD
jgi:hypothetical protein